MCEPKPDVQSDGGKKAPAWLIFVERVSDDGPWLRMLVLNPFNGAMCPLLSTPVEAELCIVLPRERGEP